MAIRNWTRQLLQLVLCLFNAREGCMNKGWWLGLLLLAPCQGAVAQPPEAGAGRPAAERKQIEVPPRTPLYCEDGAHTIQPLVYGDFGDLVGAYDRLEHWPALVVSNGRRADGEDYYVLMFSAPANDPKSPNEQVGFVITRHADGYALRSAYDQPKDLPVQKTVGTELCMHVLKMFLDADPQRAAAFRKRWGEQHPDSTSH
jgi:hypothetical protein